VTETGYELGEELEVIMPLVRDQNTEPYFPVERWGNIEMNFRRHRGYRFRRAASRESTTPSTSISWVISKSLRMP
jgi:hypothetical protein